MMEYQSHELNNGLKVIHKYLNSDVAYCGFIINVGSRDEKEDEFGMAHFVEHMLFKGTKKRKSHHIINRMENVGGELNAYTNKEETVIYSAFQEIHFARAIELLVDMTFNSTFYQKEIDKEVDVIIDEIHSYEDNPSELIFDEYENLIFKNTQLGHNILGEPLLLETFTTDKIIDFANRYYIPTNAIFFYLGKTPFKYVIKLLEKNCNELRFETYLSQREAVKNLNTESIKIDKNTSQSHVLIGAKSFDLYHPDKTILQLVNNVLGGPGMNSRLNIALRERRGLVYTIESNLITYTDCGILTIYFGSDHKSRNKCIEIVLKELKKLKDKKLSTIQLHNAKKQIIGQISISNDNHENLALDLAKNYLRYDHIDTIDEVYKKFDNITSQQILDVNNEILDEKNLTSLIYI